MSTELLEKSKPQSKQAPAPASTPQAKTAPAAPASTSPVRSTFAEEEAEPGFFRRNWLILGIAAVGISGAIYFFSGPSKPASTPKPRSKVEQVRVTITPPLPPPPPPKIEPPKEQPKEEMEKETAPEEEPPPDDTPSEPAPSVTSNGPAGNDNFGLTRGKSGSGNSNTRTLGGNRSRFGAYAGQVQSTISGAIRRNSKTKTSNMSVIARIWADETGRVTRATLSGSSGDPAIDAALKNEVLIGLQLQAPPPAGMKMPINLKLTTRAPR